MAAAQRGRKKTQTRRKQKKYGRKSQPKQRKSQAKRKRQARRKPVGKHGKSSRRQSSRRQSSTVAPASYDSKMLKQLQRDSKLLSPKAKGLMFSFVNDIYRKVSTEAERLRKQSRRPTIGPSQMQAALQQVMPRKQVRRSATPVSKRSR